MKHYIEEQYFGAIIKWVLVSFIIGMNLVVLVGLVLDDSTHVFENILEWIVPPIVLLFILTIIFLTRLKTVYEVDAISYRLMPFEFKTKTIPKTEIQHMEIKQFKWYQYGGFGKRRKVYSKLISYVMHCGPMLEINLVNGKKRRFSIKHKNQLTRFLKEHYLEVFSKE